jgi:hypothetical protein
MRPLMYFFQLDGGRDAFWISFAAYLVLLTPGRTPRSLAAARVGSTLFGVLLLAVTSLIVPTVIGCAIARVAAYLLWPRDSQAEPVPVAT